MGRLDGKVSIITGSTSGMGRASAELFAKEGAKVVVVGRNEERAKQVVDNIKSEGGEAIYILADMTNPDDLKNIVDKTVEEYGTIDVLFNNAGTFSLNNLMDLSREEWNKILAINVTAAFLLTQLVVPVMKEKQNGTIINTGSAASLSPQYGPAGYVTSKHAIAGLTKSIAYELGPEIRCNCIAPGLIDTPMVEGTDETACNAMMEATPMKRIGKGEDIANMAVFLASDESTFVDGQIIRVDGGVGL
ncbi:MAG: SDR family oxidoreductase [Methanosphaera stadtmanae]|nr:SDR family oxidoreductase [Methanosphaera stadtmanae]